MLLLFLLTTTLSTPSFTFTKVRKSAVILCAYDSHPGRADLRIKKAAHLRLDVLEEATIGVARMDAPSSLYLLPRTFWATLVLRLQNVELMS
jgi:hypothetical protein